MFFRIASSKIGAFNCWIYFRRIIRRFLSYVIPGPQARQAGKIRYLGFTGHRLPKLHQEMQSLEEHFEEFENLNIIPFGISVDPVPGKRAWAEKLGLKKLKILSDFYPLGFAARMMGVYLPGKGFSRRANILLDPAGEVIWTEVYDLDELPDVREVLRACREVI